MRHTHRLVYRSPQFYGRSDGSGRAVPCASATRQLKQELAMNGTLLAVGMITLIGISSVHAAGDVAAGKAKAAACVGCHGANGEGVGPNPPLAGMSESQFVQAMEDYKSGKRANPVMKTFATPLSAEDNGNLAAYYASLPKK
jgi:cytochrome c553